MKNPIDPEEKELLFAYEAGVLDLAAPSKKELAQIRTTARNTLRKNRRVTIRLYDHDLKGLQKKALQKGIPYQTLISSMIHQYVEGDLIEA
jgi:predicted DNA binding CopG/RHH family protein